jgi:hypothetical protein
MSYRSSALAQRQTATRVEPAARGVLQRKGVRGRQREAIPIVAEVLRSSGQPLDTSVRAFFEPRLGHDLSHVRVHADAKAAESARAVNALAYTVGSHVVFSSDRYRSQSTAARHLVAHELTHVVQQSSMESVAGVRHLGPGAQDRYEREAGTVAARIASDQPASVTGVPLPAISQAPVAIMRLVNPCLEECEQAFNRCLDHTSFPPECIAARSNCQRGCGPEAPGPPTASLATIGADTFEAGAVSGLDVKSDPNWVENDIVADQLSDQAPWTYTLTYKDGAKLVIPLTQVFNQRLAAATITVYRKLKVSGRIVPCVLDQSDPRLKELKGPMGDVDALANLATPRFDATTAPHLVSLLNAAQMVFLAKGMAEVLQVQAMNPLMGGGMGAAGRTGAGAAGRVGAGAAARGLAGAGAKEGLTFVEIGAGDLKAAIELAKKGGVKVIAVDPQLPAAAAVKELEGLGGQFVKGVATDVAPGSADHVFQYFPWKYTGSGRFAQGGTFRLVEDSIKLLKPGGAGHFVTEEFATAEYLAGEASKRGLKAVITETTAGAAAPGASGAGVPAFSKALKVWLVNIYK